jgi:hypothetical protein
MLMNVQPAMLSVLLMHHGTHPAANAAFMNRLLHLEDVKRTD